MMKAMWICLWILIPLTTSNGIMYLIISISVTHWNAFSAKVDLIEEGGLRNKYFIANVNRTKQMIYG